MTTVQMPFRPPADPHAVTATEVFAALDATPDGLSGEEAGRRLPIGVMLGGRFGAEEVLLSLSAQLEAAVGWQHPFVSRDPDPVT